jgi:hypothetical protein
MTWSRSGSSASAARVLLGIIGALALACAGGKEDGEVPEDTNPGDDDTGVTGDSDDGIDTGPAAVFDPEAPSFIATFNGAEWAAAEGYWQGGATSYLRANGGSSARTENTIIEITGDIHNAGRFPVRSIVYAEANAQSSFDLKYEVKDPPGVFFVVEGFANGDELFGALEGEATVTDSIGSAGSVPWTGTTLRSWPAF